MSMLAILICAFVFTKASGVQSFSVDSFVSSIPVIGPIKDDIENVVDEGIATLENDLAKAINISRYVAGELEDAAVSVVTKFTDSIKSVVKEMAQGIEGLFNSADGKNVSSCLKIPSNVIKNSYAVITNVTSCVTDKIEEGVSYVSDVASKIYDALKDFYELKENIDKCKDGSGILNALKSPFCEPLITGETLVSTVAKIPGGAIDFAELTSMVLTLVFTIPSCIAENAVSSISTDAQVAVSTIKQCISEII